MAGGWWRTRPGAVADIQIRVWGKAPRIQWTAFRSRDEDVALFGHGALGHEEGRGIPGLPGHSARCAFRAVQPFGKGPIAHGTGTREALELEPCLAGAAGRGERGDPEAADHRPDAAIVVLPDLILAVACHVGAPESASPADRTGDYANGVEAAHSRPLQSVEGAAARAAVGEAVEHGEEVAEDIALLAEEGEVDEAQVQIAIACAAQHVFVEEARAAVGREARREGMEQAVEAVASLLGVIESVATLDGIPQRVGIEHEPGPRHDVRPVAGLILLQ